MVAQSQTWLESVDEPQQLEQLFEHIIDRPDGEAWLHGLKIIVDERTACGLNPKPESEQ
ncbi:hypothetical protein [Thiorhodospira sibirica]|uniref:hypothetical protein n=1 Tax=Thiorhodospira sibirica TaxID=154347 RepID=UPI00030E1610|nr:hypothetical protein [Thiorhodospira sibirica]